MSTDGERRERIRLGSRLGLAGIATFLVAVPFSLLTILVLTEAPWLVEWDVRISERAHRLARAHDWLAATAKVLDWALHPFVLRGVAIVAAVVLWRRGRRRVVAWLAATMITGGLLGVGLKAVVERSRPVFDDPIATILGYSFPSGHTTNAAMAAGCALVLLYPRARTNAGRAGLWAAAVGFALLVGADRVIVGAHYVSDVLAGYVVGTATVLAMLAAFALWREEEGLPPSHLEEGLAPEEDAARHR